MDEKKVRDVIKLLELYIEGYNYIIRRNPDDELRCLKAIEKKNQLETAIEALEKQLPKKPNILSEVEGEIDFDCPECERRYVMLKEDAMQCCPYCECRFDWSEQT